MGAHPTQPGRLSGTEVRLAEQYVSVLDFVSRCAQAIDSGDWFYLHDKAGQLEDAAGRLAKLTGETWQEIGAGKPRPRAEAFRAAVASFGRHYRAARLLHPTEPHQNAEGGGRDVA
jgi:hypothetical protein